MLAAPSDGLVAWRPRSWVRTMWEHRGLRVPSASGAGAGPSGCVGVVVLVAARRRPLRVAPVPRRSRRPSTTSSTTRCPARRTSSRAQGETVYRIDPTQSDADLRGRGEAVRPGRAHGRRAPRTASPVTSRSTPRTRRRAASARSSVNVEQLHSDNNLRDARLRAANLELARLPARVPHGRRTSADMPATIDAGRAEPLQDRRASSRSRRRRRRSPGTSTRRSTTASSSRPRRPR